MKHPRAVLACIVLCTLPWSALCEKDTIRVDGAAQIIKQDLLVENNSVDHDILRAEDTLVGSVIDASNDEPLIGASILIEGTLEGTTSDLNGNFEITTDLEFPLQLVVSYIGYITQQVQYSDNLTSIDIRMVKGVLINDEVVISAFAKQEKVQDAPASISVITNEQLKNQALAHPMQALRNVAGVQLLQEGTEMYNISQRGIAGAFGTESFIMMDYRSLASSGLGFIDLSNTPVSTLDFERVEVIRGPGSVLYGPGISSGVIHFRSLDPIKHPGTSIQLIGGERSTFKADVRHAWRSESKKFGYKVNASFRRSNDWPLDPNDPDDAAIIATFQDEIIDQVTGEVVYRTGGMLRKDNLGYGVNATLEFQPKPNLQIVATGGYNRFEGLFRQSFGEALGQSNEWFGQARVLAGNFFGQFFVTRNTGGVPESPTFFYRSGETARFANTQVEGQVQYNFDIPSIRTNLVVGAEYRATRTDTKGTTYGRFEDDDNYDIGGVYFQAKTDLGKKFNLMLGSRLDRYTAISKTYFSPSAGLVYKANALNSIRFTFNKTWAVPLALDLFADLPVQNFGAFDVWVLGGSQLQTFSSPPVTTSFIPGVPENDGIGMNLQSAYAVVLGALSQQGGLPEDLLNYLASEIPGISGFSDGVPIDVDGNVLPLEGTRPAEGSPNITYEIGYKGIVAKKLSVSIDLYRVERKNLYSQPIQLSPLVVLPSMPEDLEAEVASVLDPDVLSDYGLTPAEVAAIFQQVAEAIARPGGIPSPLGLVETDQVPDEGLPHLAFGLTNTGVDYTFWGTDIGLNYYFHRNFSLFANYSWIIDSKQGLPDDDTGDRQVNFNVPTNKYRIGLTYYPTTGLHADIFFQHDDAFESVEGVYQGFVQPKNVVDIGVGYNFSNGLSIDVTGTNIFNNEFRSFPGYPKIGRQILGKITYRFGQN